LSNFLSTVILVDEKNKITPIVGIAIDLETAPIRPDEKKPTTIMVNTNYWQNPIGTNSTGIG